MHKNIIYDPREDSFLLAEAVKVYAKGKTLDIGTGSGIQAITAAKKSEVTKVVAVDINTDALEHAKKWNHNPKIDFIQSDLFSNINEKFDTIMFNPPYLPDDPRVQDVALDGGKKGYELSVRFLKDAKKYLNKDGQILFLFSSLTHKDIIENTLVDNAYNFEEVIKQNLDFEILYVYKITNVESLVKDVENLKFFTKGKRGLIYTGDYQGKKVAVKIRNPRSDAKSRIYIEGNNLKEVNKIGIGPKLIYAEEDYLFYEFVEGVLFPEFLEKAEKKEVIEILLKTFEQLRKLDMLKLNKEEMCNPYKHILIDKSNNVVMIDFERSTKDLRPGNITQFCQYLISDKISTELRKKEINIDKKTIIELAQVYKSNYYQDKDYDNIIALIK